MESRERSESTSSSSRCRRSRSTLSERNWRKLETWNVADVNDLYFHLGYVSAFRTFETVRLLAVHHNSDGAFVMTRVLVETIIRSLSLAQPGNPEERQLRLWQAEEYAFSQAATRRRAIGDQAGAADIEVTLDELHIQTAGKKPLRLSDMAKQVGLEPVYDDLYRLASVPIHGSLMVLADVLTGEKDLGTVYEMEIPLLRPGPDLSREALARSILVYAKFLELAECTVHLGIAERAAVMVSSA